MNERVCSEFKEMVDQKDPIFLALAEGRNPEPGDYPRTNTYYDRTFFELVRRNMLDRLAGVAFVAMVCVGAVVVYKSNESSTGEQLAANTGCTGNVGYEVVPNEPLDDVYSQMANDIMDKTGVKPSSIQLMNSVSGLNQFGSASTADVIDLNNGLVPSSRSVLFGPTACPSPTQQN